MGDGSFWANEIHSICVFCKEGARKIKPDFYHMKAKTQLDHLADGTASGRNTRSSPHCFFRGITWGGKRRAAEKPSLCCRTSLLQCWISPHMLVTLSVGLSDLTIPPLPLILDYINSQPFCMLAKEGPSNDLPVWRTSLLSTSQCFFYYNSKKSG